MVVGRRRVAAASVATAYALHVYVLQHHFRPPQTDRPSLLLPTHPHCRKVGAQRSRSGYFSWVLVPPSPPFTLFLFLSVFLSLTLDHSDRSAPLARTLSIHRPFQPSAHTPLAYVRSSFLLRATRREAPGRTVPHRAPPSHSGLSPSIRPLLTFSFFCSDFLPLLLMLLTRLGLSVPHSALHPN